MRDRRSKAKTGEFRAKPRTDKARATTNVVRGKTPVRGTAVVRGTLSVPATEAKNRFGEVLKAARAGSPVFIERHGRHQAVVLDIDTYQSLLAKHRTPDEQRLETLREEFDALYARMQTAGARDAVERLSTASDEEINRIVASRG